MKKLTLVWLYAAVARAVKTMAQTALGMFTVGMAAHEVEWKYVLSVALVSGLFSLLTSIATNLPEITTDGTFILDRSDPDRDKFRVDFGDNLDTLSTKNIVKFNVDRDTRL